MNGSVERDIAIYLSEQNKDISTSISLKSRRTSKYYKKMCLICNDN